MNYLKTLSPTLEIKYGIPMEVQSAETYIPTARASISGGSSQRACNNTILLHVFHDYHSYFLFINKYFQVFDILILSRLQEFILVLFLHICMCFECCFSDVYDLLLCYIFIRRPTGNIGFIQQYSHCK